ncbi:MAG UNVERIFIED_CONTAM: outer-membrane lipoprotein carrier protein LolA [Rickettsiaceae bacterium]|jgi:outer membrane lipoprotein-sorting protein
MNQMIQKIFIYFCLVAITSGKIYAADINTISKYLENIKSVSMDFVQIDSRGEKAEGKLIIVKPNRFRCNYYSPYPLLLLGNKQEIAIYDYQLEQLTRIERDDNLFDFLLAQKTDFGKTSYWKI